MLVKSLSVFANRVLNFIVSGVLNKLKGFDVYYWLVTLLGLAFLIPSNFVYSIPHNVNMVWGLFLIIMFIQWISAKSSKYVPNNLDEFLSIMIVSPGAGDGFISRYYIFNSYKIKIFISYINNWGDF